SCAFQCFGNQQAFGGGKDVSCLLFKNRIYCYRRRIRRPRRALRQVQGISTESEIRSGDDSAAGVHDRLGYDILKLTHVGRPGVREKLLVRLFGESVGSLRVGLLMLLQEIIGKQHKILPACAERGEGDAYDVESIIWILAKTARLDQALGLLVSGGNNAYVNPA